MYVTNAQLYANRKHQSRYLETISVKVSNLFIKYGFQK